LYLLLIHARAHHPDAATREAFRACNRWAPLARMLLAQRPDVLCLQEVCQEAAEGSAFCAALPVKFSGSCR
jgi:hypothetical protein